MRVNENIKYRVVLGQAVLVDASGVFRGIAKLNKTASAIWQGLMAGKSEVEIAEDLAFEFDVDKEKALLDVKAMVAKFKDQGFLED